VKKEIRVIVVDDEVEVRNLIKSFLELDGYHIDITGDGYQAIELIEKNDYDIVIADYRMPGIDGIEVIKKAREIRNYIAALLITGFGTQEIVLEAFKEGDVNNYLSKPFESRELRRLVRLSIQEQQIKKREDNLWQELMLKVNEATFECENKNKLLERDQERIRKLNIQLEKLAITDGLTGLYNYRYFQKRMSEELSRAVRFNLSLSCIMIDIDHFKDINDMYGHQIGDEILQGLSGIVKDSVRDIDIAARYGGEEFVLILPQIDIKGAGIMAERLREKVESHCFSDCSRPINITVSIGVATYPGDGIKNGNDLLKRADNALYKAKHMGRNRVIIRSPAKGDKAILTSVDKEKVGVLLEERLNELMIIDSAILGIHRNVIFDDPREENLKLIVRCISQMAFNPVAAYFYDEVNDLLIGGVDGSITGRIKRSRISLSSLEEESILLKIMRERYIPGIIDISVVESSADLSEGEKKILKELGIGDTPLAIVPFTGEDRCKGIVIGTKEVITKKDIDFLRTFMTQVILAIENLNLQDKNRKLTMELQKKTKEISYRRLEQQTIETVAALIKEIEAKDQYTKGHSNRVGIYSVYIARAMGLSPKDVEKVRSIAILHDIGKIGIPRSTLHKTEKLTKEEYDEIKRHPVNGVNILGNWFKEMRPSVRWHHEREDGKGYPDGKSGNEIPQIAKIMNIADSFDAMTSKRPYREKLSMCEMLFEMIRCSGKQFDPKIMEVFIRKLTEESIEIKEDGKAFSVRLSNHNKKDLIRLLRERAGEDIDQDNRYKVDRDTAGYYINILEGKAIPHAGHSWHKGGF